MFIVKLKFLRGSDGIKDAFRDTLEDISLMILCQVARSPKRIVSVFIDPIITAGYDAFKPAAVGSASSIPSPGSPTTIATVSTLTLIT